MNDGMNKVLLLGNLGAEPELRHTAAGTPVLHVRLATSESWLDKSKEPQERQERTEWHSVVVWGPRGAALAKILQKGSSVLVEGTLRTSSYDKEGVKHYRTEVVARDIFLTGRKPSGARSDEPSRGAASALNGSARRSAPDALDELPF